MDTVLKSPQSLLFNCLPGQIKTGFSFELITINAWAIATFNLSGDKLCDLRVLTHNHDCISGLQGESL